VLLDSTYVDVHAHLEMADDPQRLLEEAYADGIRAVVAVSINLDSYDRTTKLASKKVRIYPAIGIHPWEALAHSHEVGRAMARVEEAKFVGEIGLDYYFTGAREREAQLSVFSAFLQACDGTKKVLNIHSVGAERQVLALLKRRSLAHVNLHWYDAIERMTPLALLPDFVELGCFFSIPPAVATSKSLREVVRRVPLNNLLTETDTHPNVKYGGIQSAPKMAAKVVREIGTIKKVDLATVERTLTRNFARLIS